MNLKKFNEIDASGNELKCNKHGYLTLNLISEPKIRKIGKLIEGKDGTPWYIKGGLTEDKHVMRKNDSFGLHHRILELLPEDAYLGVICDETKYYIELKKALSNGTFLWFKSQGFERQFFVPRIEWSIK